MPEQRKSFRGHIIHRAMVIVLTILPYLLVTTCGALAVAAVARTSTRVINTKFNAVIHALNRR